ncbi:MAG TPA: GIY-YIG nuclease family protein, partial [Campylobacterales bacterium]|nr:GIY-YIG nuclease family protein [Campylobacterales bacterium]
MAKSQISMPKILLKNGWLSVLSILKRRRGNKSMDKLQILDEIFANDPFGMLDVKAKTSVRTSDDRLVSSFEEINEFIDKHEREPQKNMSDMQEMQLFSRLKGIKENSEKIEQLKSYDRHNLLAIAEEKKINSLDDIFNDDSFGLLDDSEDIFTLKHVPKEREETDFVARRKPCKNFDEYESLFKECQAELKEGKRKLIKFTEHRFDKGTFFVLKGLMGYLVKKVVKKGKFSKVDGRIHCVFENGTESNMLFRSLGKGLYDDGYLVSEHEDRVLDGLSQITKEDEETGFIYILKSKSDNPEIKSIENLYKIGFSKTDVKERIKNAENEPTYLMSAVSMVTTFKTYN